jgi:LPXTG-motif cell wall-anchored protein
MRIRVLLPAAVGMLLLAGPATAAAQDVDYAPAVPAAQAPESLAPVGDPGEQVGAAQTETEPDQTEEPGPAEPGGDSDGVPQQYTDPLAGQNEGDGQEQPAAETSAPAATGVQSVSAAGQLPSTGAPAGLFALAGAALLAAGAILRLLFRDSVYPYPYRRY